MTLRRLNLFKFASSLGLAGWIFVTTLQGQSVEGEEGAGRIYGGGGIAYTDFRERSNDSPWGYRLYGGYDFFEIPAVARFSAEGGFMQTGSYETAGNGTDRQTNVDVGVQSTLTVFPTVDLHARLGFEFGNNTGPFYAFGIAVDTAITNTFLRAEFQRRDDFNAGILSLEIQLR